METIGHIDRVVWHNTKRYWQSGEGSGDAVAIHASMCLKEGTRQVSMKDGRLGRENRIAFSVCLAT